MAEDPLSQPPPLSEQDNATSRNTTTPATIAHQAPQENRQTKAMRANVPPKVPHRLIHQVIAAEKIHLTHQIAALHTLKPSENFATHRLPDDSLTILSSPRYGWKLNHTVGFGMSGGADGAVTVTNGSAIEAVPAVSNGDAASRSATLRNSLTRIEGLYGAQNPPRIDVCEFADPGAREVLLEHGRYEVSVRIETLALELSSQKSEDGVTSNDDALSSKLETPAVEKIGEVEIQQYKDGEGVQEFIEASIAGFRSNGRSPELLGLLAESAARRPDTVRYRALVNGQLAGTAGFAVFDVDGAKVATLYIDSTLPGFRGKGVHQALLQARLAAAKQAGCDIATGSAREGSGSARNLEKAALRRAYVCDSFTRVGVAEAADARQ